MRRLTFLALIVTSLLAIPTLSSFSQISGEASDLRQEPSDSIIGADNPGSIPDFAAYEGYFRSLTARPDEGAVGVRRTRTFAEQSELEGTNVDALLIAAQNFVQQVGVLDNEVKEIKDRHWPAPNASVMARLEALQRKKESAITETVSALGGRIGPASARKLRTFIDERVKRQISATKIPPPDQGHQHGAAKVLRTIWGLIEPAAAASAQYSSMNYSYTYSTAAYNMEAQEIYGYSSLYDYYSSYGHTYSVTATTSLQGGYTVSSSYPGSGYQSGGSVYVTNVIPFFVNGTWFDGEVRNTTSGTTYCPILNRYNYPAGSSSTTALPRYFTLGAFDPQFSPAYINPGEASSIWIHVTGSQSIQSTDRAWIEFGQEIVYTNAKGTIIVGGSQEIGPGSRVRGSYTAGSLCCIQVKAVASLTSRTAGVSVTGSPKTSTAVLTVAEGE